SQVISDQFNRFVPSHLFIVVKGPKNVVSGLIVDITFMMVPKWACGKVRGMSAGNHDRIRDQLTVIPAVADDIPDDGGADIGGARGGQQKDGLDLGKLSVGMGNGLFKFKVRGVAESPEDEIGPDLPTVIDGHSLIGPHLDLGLPFKGPFDKLDALLQGEHVFFVGIDPNGDHQFVKKGKSPFYDIVMSQGKWIEGTGKEGTSHGRSCFSKNRVFYRKASSMAEPKMSSREIPAARACCGKRLSSVNPGVVFTSNRWGRSPTKMNSDRV